LIAKYCNIGAIREFSLVYSMILPEVW